MNALRVLAGSLLQCRHGFADRIARAEHLMETPRVESTRSVDVVVPVYGAAVELRRCLASVLRHGDLERHRIVLVVDGPQDAAVEAAVSEAGSREGVVVLRQETRCGFPAAANRGLAHSRSDVLLLNSDTEVTAGWVEKLQEAAWSAPDVATATPFSNNATICSLPRFLEENTLPAGYDLDELASLVERRSERAYPRIPTAVGVCMYVRRDALDDVGLFDENAFGLGYGEESDFSMRAAATGRVHVLDDATYIFHAGRGSFGSARSARVRRAHRVMRRRHPHYLPRVAEFIREDPLRPVRERVISALTPERRAAPSRLAPASRVVHVVQGWPPFDRGGTELYARWLASRQAAWRHVAVYSRIARDDRGLGEFLEHLDEGIRVRLAVNNFTQRNPLFRNALHVPVLRRDFARFLRQERPDLVHVHHLAGHCLDLLHVPELEGVPVVYQVQDWFGPCARINLYIPGVGFCAGPAPAKCGRCLPLTGIPPRGLWNPLLYRLRRRLFRRVLRRADRLVCGSRFLVDSHAAYGFPLPAGRTRVVPYGVELPRSGRDDEHRPTTLPLRFGVIGAVLPHKGVATAVEAFAGLDPERATLEIRGKTTGAPDYVESLVRDAPPAVSLRGPFPEGQKADVLDGLDVLLVPSLGLESFGLAAREASARGVPVLAADRGALPEMFEQGVAGSTFPAGDAAALRAWIERLADDPGQVDRWRAGAGAVKGMDEHALEIEAIYQELVPPAGRGAKAS